MTNYKFCIWMNGRLLKECTSSYEDVCSLVRLTKSGNFLAATHYSESPRGEMIPLTKDAVLKWQKVTNSCVGFLSICLWAYLTKPCTNAKDEYESLRHFVMQVTPDKISGMTLNTVIRGRARKLLGDEPNDRTKVQIYDMLYEALKISFDNRENVPKSNADGTHRRFFNAVNYIHTYAVFTSEKSQVFSEEAAKRSLIEKTKALSEEVSKEFGVKEKRYRKM